MHYPFVYEDEVFKPITIPEILPIYLIGNYGTVIDTTTGERKVYHLTSYEFTTVNNIPKGYPTVILKTTNGRSKSFLVHRLLMMTFHPLQENEYTTMEVNHINGDKYDIRESELEWVTPQENVQHAFRTGLNRNIRQNNAKAVLTNDQVRIICQCLQDGVPMYEIESLIGPHDSNDFIRNIRSIYSHTSWNSISKDYTFKEYPNLRNSLTDDEATIACEILSKGGSYLDILRAIGRDPDQMSKDELWNFCDVISNIRVGRYYSNISKNYTFDNSKGRHDQLLTFDQVRQVCEYLQNGYSIDDILKAFELTRDKLSYDEYQKYRGLIWRIKNRRAWTSISNDYNF